MDWANLKLTDSEGNEYSRMDDEFISELGMTRMAGTTLNFGSNEAGSHLRLTRMQKVWSLAIHLRQRNITAHYKDDKKCRQSVSCHDGGMKMRILY